MEYMTIDTPMEFLPKTMKLGRGINPIKILTEIGDTISTVVIEGMKIVVPYNVPVDKFVIKDIVE
jgi:hypothetical protein